MRDPATDTATPVFSSQVHRATTGTLEGTYSESDCEGFDMPAHMLCGGLMRGLALLLPPLFACGSSPAQPARSDDAAITAGDAGAGECCRHRDCVDQHGVHWICRSDHTCVNLLSDSCGFVRGDDANDDAVFVGV